MDIFDNHHYVKYACVAEKSFHQTEKAQFSFCFKNSVVLTHLKNNI